MLCQERMELQDCIFVLVRNAYLLPLEKLGKENAVVVTEEYVTQPYKIQAVSVFTVSNIICHMRNQLFSLTDDYKIKTGIKTLLPK